jgi:ubiquinone/menaquinone biosynthesis C-methylase UbiE
MHEYDLIAEWYASERGEHTGVPEVTALASSIRPGAMVLDVGCGNGIPLTRALLRAGARVAALDSSPGMLARFPANCPGVPAVRAIVQQLPFAEESFDAAIAWGVLFHLPQAEQVRAIEQVGRVLRTGAPFLFTSGDVEGSSDEFVGTMYRVTFHYYSFTVDGYRRILRERGFELRDVHADAGKNTYYLACKVE